MWRQFKEDMQRFMVEYASYQTFRRYVWILEELGLTEFVREKKRKGKVPEAIL